MATIDNTTPVVVNGSTLGYMEPSDNGFVIKGLKGQFFANEGDVTNTLVQRRERTIALVEQRRAEQKDVRITIGNTLHDALIAEGLWIGLPVEQTKTQTTVEVENTDMIRASLQELIATLEGSARSNTRTERNSMRSRALIGAAKQQLAKL